MFLFCQDDTVEGEAATKKAKKKTKCQIKRAKPVVAEVSSGNKRGTDSLAIAANPIDSQRIAANLIDSQRIAANLIDRRSTPVPFSIITKSTASPLGQGCLFSASTDIGILTSEQLDPDAVSLDLPMSKSKLPLLLAHECRVMSATWHLCISGQHARTAQPALSDASPSS